MRPGERVTGQGQIGCGTQARRLATSPAHWLPSPAEDSGSPWRGRASGSEGHRPSSGRSARCSRDASAARPPQTCTGVLQRLTPGHRRRVLPGPPAGDRFVDLPGRDEIQAHQKCVSLSNRSPRGGDRARLRSRGGAVPGKARFPGFQWEPGGAGGTSMPSAALTVGTGCCPPVQTHCPGHTPCERTEQREGQGR